MRSLLRDIFSLHLIGDPALRVGNDPHLEHMRDIAYEMMAEKAVIDNVAG